MIRAYIGGLNFPVANYRLGSDCHVHQNKKMNFLNGRYREFHSEIKISQNDRTGNKYRG